MFFQFSPPQKPEKKPISKKEPEPDSTVLSLAPFTANPKIFFENIKVGQRSVQKLIIKNPNNLRVEISAYIALEEDINLDLNWSQLCLDPNTEDTLEISWSPKASGSWRYILHITDGKRIKRDIPIVLKSISSAKKCSKKPEPKNKGFPRYVAKKTSPIHNLNKKKSPLRRTALPDITNIPIPDIKVFSPDRNFNGKENFVSVNNSSFILHPRRDTFIVNPKTAIPEPTFDDSLENIPPPNLSFEDKLKSESFILSSVFTPTNEFQPDHCSTDEKSINTSSFVGKKVRLFQDATFELSPNLNGNGTFVKDVISDTFTKNLSSDTFTKVNTSSETKNNTSTETYLKDNISSETYTKLNLSSETYTKDISDCDWNEFATPPSTSKKSRLDSLIGNSVKSTIEAGLWSNSKLKRPLLAIKEESYCDTSNIKATPIKRKSELTFTVPSKRQNLDESHITDWSKILTVSIIDPELALWLEKQQEKFKNWLNVVLAAPSDLEAEDQKHPVDVTKLWKECQKKDITVAPVVVTSSKLNSLRKAARILYKSNDIQNVLKKLWTTIDNNRLSVRTDRDVHLDLALQASIMSILLSYNPLWLRLGLETVYSTTIPLKSNNDFIGLTTFLSQRFIRNPLFLKKYKSIHSPQYTDSIKKYILKKFLALIYFLDVAKMRKLISHDPCLFCKNAPIKESREALIAFARDIIASIGDITKYLKHFHYIVEYKQSYLDEFNYTVSCLGVDLRDGVRLTRVMEKILLQKNLSKNLRVPAISRLQKIHNMKIVFDALTKANFEVLYEISPEDIVNGHKEKTLSFLWQIIYKFQTPLMVKSVTIISKWWRSDSIQKKREVLRNVRKEKEEAALKILLWYRRIKHQEREKILVRQTQAVIKIQSCVRMFLAKRYYQKLKYCVKFVSERYMAKRLMIIERENFERLKYAVLIMQRRFKANKLAKQTHSDYLRLKTSVLTIQKLYRHYRRGRLDRMNFLQIRTATILLQTKWRATISMRKYRENYEVLKATTIMVQRKFRANLAMRKQRDQFLVLKHSVIFIQQKWKAKLEMKRELNKYLNLKAATIIVQRWYRQTSQAKLAYNNFHKLKASVILMQRRWRANIEMRRDRDRFEVLRFAAIMVQNKFRANLEMNRQRNQFQSLKYAAIVVQRRWRAQIAMRREVESYQKVRNYIICIQRKWRAVLEMRTARNSYLLLKSSVIVIQNRFRANLLMKISRGNYQKLKTTIVFIQRKWRAQKAMKYDFANFMKLKSATIIIQRQWRALIAMKKERNNFNAIKSATILIQRRFRAYSAMKLCKNNYNNLRTATILIQMRWRATTAMKREMLKYQKLKQTVNHLKIRWKGKLKMRDEMKKYQALRTQAIIIQNRFRANLKMKQQRRDYVQLKTSVICIQRRLRATLMMKNEHRRYRELKESTILIQSRYRANKLSYQQYTEYQRLRNATIWVQRRWRSLIATRQALAEYHNMKKAVMIIQRRYRETKLAQHEFNTFVELKQATILVQRTWRAQLAMRRQRKYFVQLRQATIVVQRLFRAHLEMKETLKIYNNLRKCSILIQRKWRATLRMRIEKNHYQALRNAAILIQQRFRSKRVGKIIFDRYRELKRTCIFVQCKWRAKRRMIQDMQNYKTLKNSTLVIQRRFREVLLARQQFQAFQNLRRSVIFVQRKWRGKLLIRAQIRNLKEEKLERAVLVLQRKFRAKLLMRSEYLRFQLLKRSAIVIQKRYRESLMARSELEKYKKLKHATIFIQRKWRSQISMRKELNQLRNLRNSVLIIQQRFRANKLARLEHNRFVNLRKNVILMQKYARGFLIRRQFADFLTPEAIEQRKLLRIQSKAAIVIQSAWRGYRIRSTNKPKLRKIYEKLKKANQNAVPEKTLGCRCKKAFVQLSKRDSSVREILLVLHDLDFITRRCRQSLKKLGPVLPKPIYGIINSTNRSPPEIQVSTVAASILINLYRYEPTRVYTWIPEYLEPLLTVMLHCCDKETPLFPTLCTLIWFFASNEEYRNFILSTRKCKEKMLQIKEKCERKAKMIRRMSINYTSYFNTYERLPLPSPIPDWGLTYENKPKVFTNSIQALKCVLSVLKL